MSAPSFAAIAPSRLAVVTGAASGIGLWTEGQELLERVIAAAGGPHGEARSPGDARAILARPAAFDWPAARF